jgi:hypothetical protein
MRMKVQWQFLCQAARLLFSRYMSIVGITLFTLVSVIAGGVLLSALVPLLPLYRDATTRANVERTLRFHADQEGWLLSDISVRAVQEDRVVILHRDHHLGPDLVRCLILYYQASAPVPCAD